MISAISVASGIDGIGTGGVDVDLERVTANASRLALMESKLDWMEFFANQ